MIQLTKYQCEICQRLFDNPDEAIKCESRGKEQPLAKLGQTILYKDDWNGGFGTCFDKIEVIEIEDMGHYLNYVLGDCATKYPQIHVTGSIEFKELCTIINNPESLVNKGLKGWELP